MQFKNILLPGNSGHLITSRHKRKERVQNSLQSHSLAERTVGLLKGCSEKLKLQCDRVPVTQLVKNSTSNLKVMGLIPILVKK